MLLQNEVMMGGLCDDHNGEVIGCPLSDANTIIDWLKTNRPCSETEIDDLIRMIVGFKTNDDVSIGGYGIKDVYGQRMIFGPMNMLFVQGNEMIEYLLLLLEGLKDELRVVELDEIGCAA